MDMVNTQGGRETKSLKQKVLHGMAEYLSTSLYLALFFCIFAGYRALMLAQYRIDYEDFGFCLVKALVLSKVIIAAEKLGIGRGFRGKPLIVVTLYKTFLFGVWVALLGVVQSAIHGFIHGGGPAAVLTAATSKFDYRWLADALVVLFAFIPFFAVRELGQVLGEGTMSRLFFRGTTTTQSRPG
jgi:hypothetical protein